MAQHRDIRTDKTPPAGVRAQTAAPEPVNEDLEVTAPHVTPLERAKVRAKRPTEERVARLEVRLDGAVETLSVVREDLGVLRGGVAELVRLGTSERDERLARDKAERDFRDRCDADDRAAAAAARTAAIAEEAKKNDQARTAAAAREAAAIAGEVKKSDDEREERKAAAARAEARADRRHKLLLALITIIVPLIGALAAWKAIK